MFAQDHMEMFRSLMDAYCLPKDNLLTVNNIADWCRRNGMDEPDRDRPFRFIMDSSGGCRMLISRVLPDDVIEQRINALRIRGQIRSVAADAADRLNSETKKLAFLFLSEYAKSLPEIGTDELLADDWAFKEMERHGFFRT